MTYKDTVITCLKNYPMLYPNRLTVDDHLFAVIGNGYEWKDGQICAIDDSQECEDCIDMARSCFDVIYSEIPADVVQRYNNYDAKQKYMAGRITQEKWDDEHPELAKTLKKVLGKRDYSKLPDEDWFEPVTGDFEFSVYPICKYSKLTCIPDNVQPDWLEAIEHFVDYCLQHEEVLIHKYHTEKDTEEGKVELTRQIENLVAAKKRIDELKNRN